MANFLGLEIAPDAVRGVLVKTSLRKAQVARYVEVPIVPVSAEPAPLPVAAEGAPAPAPPEPPDPIETAIRELMLQIGAPRPAILSAIAGEDASIRRMELPAIVAKKVEELLPLESR
jgi:general secretion pathway protein L